MICRILALFFILALGLWRAPFASGAQPAPPGHRIGWLSAGVPLPDLDSEAFRQGLRALGYVEGQNLVLESRYAGGEPSSSPTWQPSWCGSKST